MQYSDLKTMITDNTAQLAKGPVALIMVEDDVEVATTLRHHQQSGRCLRWTWGAKAWRKP